MVFDPFGDWESRGHLRNFLAIKDRGIIARLERDAFLFNVTTAMDGIAASATIGYQDVLQIHKVLFQSVYPWAGQDRAVLAPSIAISKGGYDDLFAHPADIRKAVEYGLQLGADHRTMTSRPGEVFGALAYAHPFLDGNGRTLITLHTELARRCGFHIAWQAIAKPDFLRALTAELQQPRSAMDALLAPHVRPGALATKVAARHLRHHAGLRPSV